MLCTAFSRVVVVTWDDCWPLDPPSPGSEAIEYIDMRFAILSRSEVRRPGRDTAERKGSVLQLANTGLLWGSDVKTTDYQVLQHPGSFE